MQNYNVVNPCYSVFKGTCCVSQISVKHLYVTDTKHTMSKHSGDILIDSPFGHIAFHVTFVTQTETNRHNEISVTSSIQQALRNLKEVFRSFSGNMCPKNTMLQIILVGQNTGAPNGWSKVVSKHSQQSTKFCCWSNFLSIQSVSSLVLRKVWQTVCIVSMKITYYKTLKILYMLHTYNHERNFVVKSGGHLGVKPMQSLGRCRSKVL